MAIKPINVSNAQDFPGLSITPSQPDVNLQTTNALDPQDRVTISSDGGTQEINSYTVETAAGDDTVSLNGSPLLSLFDLGANNDLFQINTLGLGGSMVQSTVIGGLGNDTLKILNGIGVSNSFIDTDNGDQTVGKDLIELQGSFALNTIFTRGGDDVVRFLAPGTDGFNNFSTNDLRIGAGADLFTDGGFKLAANASTIGGGDGRDTIILLDSTTGFGADGTLIRAGGAADMVYGTAEGETTVQAGAGFDFVQTFDENDLVFGGGGSDTILLGEDEDVAFGELGNDVIFGEDGGDTIDGGEGRDIILGGYENDSIFGGVGDFQDFLAGEEGDDTIDGGSGDDLIYGDELSAFGAYGFLIPTPIRTVIGGDDGDFFTGTVPGGVATLGDLVGYTNDGAANPDILTSIVWDQPGGEPGFVVNAKSNTQPATPPFDGNLATTTGVYLANDEGGALNDVLCEVLLANNLAAPGTSVSAATEVFYFPEDGPFYPVDDITWSSGYPDNARDYLNGQYVGGDDVLVGNSGNDTIFGGGGNDEIDGGLNNDIIVGNQGSDTMTGGDGADIFVQESGASAQVAAVSVGDVLTINWNSSPAFPGFGVPDVITDFVAVNNQGFVNDRVAFDTGKSEDPPFDTQFGITNAGENVLRDNTGSATGTFGNDEIVIYRGTYTQNGGIATFRTGTNAYDVDILAFASLVTDQSGVSVFNPDEFSNSAVVLKGAAINQAGGLVNFNVGNFFADTLA